MTPLGKALIARIKATGPITLAEYMAECLLHPEHGYYSTRDPLGAAGDFTTAPEISQMFGELIGLCLAQSWLDQGAPERVVLAELGPGRGTLMADALRAAGQVPGFVAAAELVFVEASAPLRSAQTGRLPQAQHVSSVDALPEAPLFLIANEFFDALPIRQFHRDETGWRETVIGSDGSKLAPALTDPAPLAALDNRLSDTKPGDIVELRPGGAPIAAIVDARIAAHGGTALIIDYGDWRSQGDTLQAMRNHAPTDPFDAPGEADLTAHVDFEALAHAAAHTAHSRLTPQGIFLERLGITQRAQNLAGSLSGAQLDGHIAAHRRLTHPTEMGHLFKVMGLFPKGAAPPPGLEK